MHLPVWFLKVEGSAPYQVYDTTVLTLKTNGYLYKCCIVMQL